MSERKPPGTEAADRVQGGHPWLQRTSTAVRAFQAPRDSFSQLDADTAATLIAAAADISLIIDEAGIIRDVAASNESLVQELGGIAGWVGQAWVDIVALDSQPKIPAMLDRATRGGGRWRHINHAVTTTESVPVLYTTVPIGDAGRTVAFGRDLRPMSVLQQRLIDAQQAMERDYSRLRQMETRHRLLFDMSSDAILVVDAATQKVVEANRSALQMLGQPARKVVGRLFGDILGTEAAGGGQAVLNGVRTTGRAADVPAVLARNGQEVIVSASLFRQDEASLFLVSLSPMPSTVSPSEARTRDQFLKVVENAPDGFVVSDHEGRIIAANAAFLELAEMPNEDQVRGELLERWLGRPGVDFEVLIANLRQRGSVKLFATIMHGQQGLGTEVEVSAVAVTNSGRPCFGFAIRNVARRLVAETVADRAMPRSVDQLTQLIGRVSLKEVVREATDVIERLCIETALEMTGDNRASAAEMLQLSRQSLYVKLRRYGIGDLSAPEGH